MNTTFIQLNHVSKCIGEQCILKDINLTIEKEKIYLFWGANGAGKSVLINVLSGATTFDQGTISINGISYHYRAPSIEKSNILSVCPQNNCITEELTVFENLFINQNLWFQNAETFFDTHLPDFLKDFGQILRPHLYEKARNLSPSLLHLLQLTRTALSQRKLLIFDEPLVYLSDYEKRLFQQLVFRLKQEHKTIIIISHMLDYFLESADYLTILRDGTITTNESLKNYSIHDLMPKLSESIHIDAYPKLPVRIKEELLKVEFLSDHYIKDISFSLHAGEILGITGTLSSGKSQIARLIVGRAQKNYGKISIRGSKTNIRHPLDAIEKKIYYLPQDRDRNGLFLSQDIRFNIVEVNTFRSDSQSKKMSNALSNYYQHRLKISAKNNLQKVSSLSNGNRQKVMIGRAFFNDPKIYILDEPCSEIDIAGKAEIYNILNHLLLSGAGIILISSDFIELAALCDKVLFLHEGQCLQQLEKKDITPEKLYDLYAQNTTY